MTVGRRRTQYRYKNGEVGQQSEDVRAIGKLHSYEHVSKHFYGTFGVGNAVADNRVLARAVGDG
jgi:hypothetical protein